MAPPVGVFSGFPRRPNIPSSFMNKQDVPAGADTNTRPYIIFFGYLSLCVGLTLFIVQKLFKSYNVLSKSRTARPPPRAIVAIFVALTAGSLLTTWYHMIRYFYTSYGNWLMWRSYYNLSEDQKHWGLWLKDTSLFKEAWEIALVGFARYWWTSQIFFFACALGLDLEQKGIRRGIRHTWVFMLLGQIVAISFATNLFILSVLLGPPPPPRSSASGVYRSKWLGPWLLNILGVLGTVVPAFLLADELYWYGQAFFPVLLAPHLALLVLPTARALLPAKYFADTDANFTDRVYVILWGVTILGGALLGLNNTGAAVRYGGYSGIFNALNEHPAVSSVGFDVIFCWVTWITWWAVQKTNSEAVLPKGEDADEIAWGGAASSWDVSGGDSDGLLRRR